MTETSQLAVWTKLVALACASFFVAVGADHAWVLSLMALAALAFQRNFWVFLYSAFFYGVLSLLLFLGRRHEIPIFSSVSFLLLWQRMPVILVSLDLLSTPPGKLAGFLAKLGLPCRGVLGVYVVYRVFPMLGQELSCIWRTMRSRRLATCSQFLLHPFRSVGYVLVPLLLRLMQAADQMTVSAVTRGAGSPDKRSSFYEQRLSADDYFWILGWVLLVVFWIGGKLL